LVSSARIGPDWIAIIARMAPVITRTRIDSSPRRFRRTPIVRWGHPADSF
jgi:hypothetical protein